MSSMNRFAVLLFVATAFATALTNISHSATISFKDAGSIEIDIEIADTEMERRMGLMFRSPIPDDMGMWFIFEKARPQTFWMKNVSFPIDIIFIDEDFYIRKIWKSVPPCLEVPCDYYLSGFDAKYTLETVAGFCDANGVIENQRVIFKP